MKNLGRGGVGQVDLLGDGKNQFALKQYCFTMTWFTLPVAAPVAAAARI